MRSYISFGELEELGETIVREYLRKTKRYNALCVDIEGLVTDYLGLTVVYENIAEDDPNKPAEPEPTEQPEETEPPVANLTAENCPDLANLLALRDPSDPSVATFASEYSGRVIEFDGCVTNMQNHGSYTTRWDVLLGAGDFDPESMRGPNFRLTDVNFSEMNVTGGDSVYAGLNVHVVAKVGQYNANTTLFELDIISMEIRD